MLKEKIFINNIPTIIYGESSDKVFLFVHGKMGNKEEAERFAEIVCSFGFQVIAIDLPKHGERKQCKENFDPWTVKDELKVVMKYINSRWRDVSLRANSIGCYFSMLAFNDTKLTKCLFVSPIVDMVRLIQNMMSWAKVDLKTLEQKRYIETSFGETLDYEYFCFAKNNPAEPKSCTSIIYPSKDNLTERETIERFSRQFNCKLTVVEGMEHWFHTEEQLKVLEDWELLCVKAN